MNAKEMCEKLKEEKITPWIKYLYNHGGSFSTEPYYIQNTGINNAILKTYHSLFLDTPVDTYKILEELGYTVECLKKEFPIHYNIIYKTEEQLSGFWFFKRKKQVQVFDKYEPVMKEFVYYKITACCESEIGEVKFRKD